MSMSWWWFFAWRWEYNETPEQDFWSCYFLIVYCSTGNRLGTHGAPPISGVYFQSSTACRSFRSTCQCIAWSHRMTLWVNLRACHYFIRLLSDKGILQRPEYSADVMFCNLSTTRTTVRHRQTTWTLRCGCIIGNYDELPSCSWFGFYPLELLGTQSGLPKISFRKICCEV